jgi:methylated-DNA-[protein]-cysteine S-methyltransferase
MTSAGTIYYGQVHKTPLGDLWLACSEKGLVTLEWQAARSDFLTLLTRRFKNTEIEESPRRLAMAANELREYLAGKRKRFSLQIDWALMRSFQRQVLLATYAIPYGQTTTYGDLAQQLELARSARAVGRAEATNPIPLIIPCHRVLGADGKLRGYGGGLEIKRWLLQLEGAVLA